MEFTDSQVKKKSFSPAGINPNSNSHYFDRLRWSEGTQALSSINSWITHISQGFIKASLPFNCSRNSFSLQKLNLTAKTELTSQPFLPKRTKPCIPSEFPHVNCFYPSIGLTHTHRIKGEFHLFHDLRSFIVYSKREFPFHKKWFCEMNIPIFDLMSFLGFSKILFSFYHRKNPLRMLKFFN